MDFIDKKFLSRKASADKTKLDNMFRDHAGDKNTKVKKWSEMSKTRKEKKVPEIYKSI